VHKVNRALLARETGWTFDYIDERLDFQDAEETLAIYEAVDRAQAWAQQREMRKAQKKPARGRR
jgi:hypothetical protein